MSNIDYKKNIQWKEKFSNDLAEFRKRAYVDENLMPKRYVLVLTNLCNLACDFLFSTSNKTKRSLKFK